MRTRSNQSLLLILLIGLSSSMLSCKDNTQRTDKQQSVSQTDTILRQQPQITTPATDTGLTAHPGDKEREQTNFRNLSIEEIGQDRYRISGQARVFEATVSWAVEKDGKEIKHGFVTADKGAPAWGDFTFAVTLPPQQSTEGTEVLVFENSAKDGSRQHIQRLPLP